MRKTSDRSGSANHSGAPNSQRLKQCCGWLFAIAVLAAWWPAQATDDINGDYLRIFFQVQKADSLNASGRFKAAMPRYDEARTNLVTLQRFYPNWNPKVVAYKLRYVDEKILALNANLAPAITNRPSASRARSPQPLEAEAEKR